MFPSNYPFAPPAIRMHTPSGRFQPSTRLCLSISDFHPKSFNPAWEVSTILIGLMSFMTSDEMTTGSVSANESERRLLARKSRWWNSTGGGTSSRKVPGVTATTKGIGAVKAGDGGVKFRAEYPELDEENWKWMTENRVDPSSGQFLPDPNAPQTQCSPGVAALGRQASASRVGAVVDGGQAARDAGQGWLMRNKLYVGATLIVAYVLLARFLSEDM